MAGIVAILRGQWISYWRKVKRPGNLTAGHQGALLLVGGLILFKYVQLLRLSALDLSNGRTTRAELLLSAVFLIWMFPLVGDPQFGVVRRSTHLPFPFLRLYFIRLLSPFVTARSWVILISSAGMFYWLLYASQPAAGLTAIILFVAFSYLCGLAAADLIATAAGRRVLIVLLVVMLVGATAAFALTGQGLMLMMRRVWLFLPPHLVGKTLVGEQAVRNLAIMAGYAVAAWALSIRVTKSSLMAGPVSGPRARLGFFLSILPGKFVGLIAKDFRHFQRLPDLYFSVLVVIAAAFYLITAPEPEVEVLWPFLILYFLSNVLASFNFFGADDASGFDRYMLMPLTGRMIILSKNLAYLLLVAVQAAPIVCLAAWRMGLALAFLSLIEAAGMMFCYLAWGNWLSIARPRRLRFFRFSSEGPLVDLLLGIAFGSLPGVLGVVLAARNGDSLSSLIWQMILMLIASLMIYLASLLRFGRSLEQRHESIRTALS